MCMFKKRQNELMQGIIGPDPEDVRDWKIAEIQPETVELPKEFSLIMEMPSIQKQYYGTCTAHAVDGVKEFLDSKEYGRSIKQSQKFIYYNTKMISGLWNHQGDYLRNALKAVCEHGVPLESTYPDIKESSWQEYIKNAPPQSAYKEAEKYKGKTFWAVGTELEQYRQAIFQQRAPLPFSMRWRTSYNKTATDGKLSLPNGNYGGHAIDCIGWTENKLWFRNSWGINYGVNGYGYIPFDEFDAHEIWNAYALLDIIAPNKIIGWVAGKYLTKIDKTFRVGDLVAPTTRLNMRKEPSTSSAKIVTLDSGQKCKVVEGGIEANGYTWYKVQTN